MPMNAFTMTPFGARLVPDPARYREGLRSGGEFTEHEKRALAALGDRLLGKVAVRVMRGADLFKEVISIGDDDVAGARFAALATASVVTDSVFVGGAAAGFVSESLRFIEAHPFIATAAAFTAGGTAAGLAASETGPGAPLAAGLGGAYSAGFVSALALVATVGGLDGIDSFALDAMDADNEERLRVQWFSAGLVILLDVAQGRPDSQLLADLAQAMRE